MGDIMKKFFIILSIALVGVVILGCSNNGSKRIDDKRIIGTWESDYFGTYVFKENGTVEVLAKDNVRKFETENSLLKIYYNNKKIADSEYSYEIIYGVTESGESQEILALWNYYEGTNSKKYYTKK